MVNRNQVPPQGEIVAINLIPVRAGVPVEEFAQRGVTGQIVTAEPLLALDAGQGQKVVLDELGDGLCVPALPGLVVPRDLSLHLGPALPLRPVGLRLTRRFFLHRLRAGDLFLAPRLLFLPLGLDQLLDAPNPDEAIHVYRRIAKRPHTHLRIGGKGGSSLDKVASVQDCRMGRAR